MKFFYKRYDGGEESNVTGYWLIEWKRVFSIVLLKFEPNHRENFHSHAFNAVTFWIKGVVTEERIDLETKKKVFKKFKAGDVKYTPIDNVHKIHCEKPSWALCFRGPWKDRWIEYNENSNTIIHLTHGRRVL